MLALNVEFYLANTYIDRALADWVNMPDLWKYVFFCNARKVSYSEQAQIKREKVRHVSNIIFLFSSWPRFQLILKHDFIEKYAISVETCFYLVVMQDNIFRWTTGRWCKYAIGAETDSIFSSYAIFHIRNKHKNFEGKCEMCGNTLLFCSYIRFHV